MIIRLNIKYWSRYNSFYQTFFNKNRFSKNKYDKYKGW